MQDSTRSGASRRATAPVVHSESVVSDVDTSVTAPSVQLHASLGNQVVRGALSGDDLGGLGAHVTGSIQGEIAGNVDVEESNADMQGVVRRVAPEAQEDEEAHVAEVIERLPSGGSALPEVTRARMEYAFDHDFSHVRVHEGGGAAQAAADLNAHAFALGADLYFGPGEYVPGTPAGDVLLAHELTHVVQADAGRLGGEGGVSSPSDATEQEAYGNEVRIVALLQQVDQLAQQVFGIQPGELAPPAELRGVAPAQAVETMHIDAGGSEEAREVDALDTGASSLGADAFSSGLGADGSIESGVSEGANVGPEAGVDAPSVAVEAPVAARSRTGSTPGRRRPPTPAVGGFGAGGRGASAGYSGGHMIGAQLGGSAGADNLVAGSAGANAAMGGIEDLVSGLDLGSALGGLDPASMFGGMDLGSMMGGFDLGSMMGGLDLGGMLEGLDPSSLLGGMNLGSMLEGFGMPEGDTPAAGGGGGGGGGGVASTVCGLDMGSMVGDTDLGSLTEGLDLGSMLGGFDLGSMMSGLDPSSIFGGIDLGSMLGDFDIGSMLGGFDLGSMLEGIDPSMLGTGGGLDLGGLFDGFDASELMGGLDLGEMFGGLDMGEMLGGVDLGGMFEGFDMSEMVGGLDLGALFGTVDVSSMLSGLDMGEMMGGMDASEMFGGLDAADMFGGLDAAEMFGGLDLGEMFGGFDASTLFGGGGGGGGGRGRR